MSSIREVSLQDLDRSVKEQVQRARSALKEGRAEYSLNVLGELLKHFPGCADLRRFRWEAACQLKPEGKGLMRSLGMAGRSVKTRMLKSAAGKQPEEVLSKADTLLAENPRDPGVLELMAYAANKLGLTGTELFAREAKVEVEPESADARYSLGMMCLESGLADQAILHAEWILQREPGHGAARELVKDASVASSLKTGNWESGPEYR